VKIVVALVTVLFLGWAAVNWLPRKARPGPEADVARFFWGLQLFGKNGAYVEVLHKETGGRLRFERVEQGDAQAKLQLEFVSVEPSLENLRQFVEQAVLAGAQVAEEQTGEAELGKKILLGALQTLHRANWEAVAKLAAEAAGWRWNDRYRVDFEGPKDYARADEFFGFKSRRRR